MIDMGTQNRQPHPTLSKIDSGFYSDAPSMPPPPQPNSLFNPMLDTLHKYNLSSRSTSSSKNAMSGHQYADNAAFVPRFSQQMPAYKQVQVRLPSDQVRQIVDALGSRQAPTVVAVSGVNMAENSPPTSRENDGMQSSNYGFFGGIPTALMHSATGQRPRSFGSDISMHPACTQFPSCTVDNSSGTDVIHSPMLTEGHFDTASAYEDASNGKTALDREDDCPARLVVNKKSNDRGRKRDHGLLNENRGNSPRKVSKTAKESFAMTVEEVVETSVL